MYLLASNLTHHFVIYFLRHHHAWQEELRFDIPTQHGSCIPLFSAKPEEGTHYKLRAPFSNLMHVVTSQLYISVAQICNQILMIETRVQ